MGFIFSSCQGEDISPPLKIGGAPQNAKSLVLIMDDPDAVKPAGRVWDHWIIWNMPPDTTEIREGNPPEGILGMNTNGKIAYRGPCPPDARHRYFFKLYALDITLHLLQGSTKAQVEKAMEGHVIAKAELVGLYEKV
ncbi:MAG: YbhB/YbcL family Raf kinase inhibitor-like protein [Candidatus Aenigmarchaeota archaeon]|nr:YbhB/YbcL family Raf kinase inhibitor-like protein [Candidatus Aenigmarchaeota archaeon]